jgi:hypothetical protein
MPVKKFTITYYFNSFYFLIKKSYDSVEIFDFKIDSFNNQSQSTMLYSLCGFNRPNLTITYSNNIQINFQTDSDQEYKGFIGIYKSVRCLFNS